jgi:hypothetical protein
MATKSIFKTINISDKKQATKLIEAIEISKNKECCKVSNKRKERIIQWGKEQGLPDYRIEQMIVAEEIMSHPGFIWTDESDE